MLILRHVLGFLIQLFPSACICCYPFWGNFKCGTKKALGTVLGIAAVGCVLFVWLGLYPPIPALAAHYQMVCNVVFNLTLALLAAYFLVMVRANLFKKVFILAIAMNYSFLLLKLIDFLLEVFGTPRDGYMYSLIGLLLHIAVNALLFYPVLRRLRRIRRAVNSPIEAKTWRQLALVPLGFIFLINLCQYFPDTMGISPQMTMEITTMAVLGFMFGVYGWIFGVIERARHQAEEAAALQAALDNYRQMAGSNEKVKQMHHDMKHHFAALHLYLEGGDPEGAKAYLHQIADEISHLPVVEYTPNPLINSILSDYKARAERAGIQVTYHILVPEALHMADIDLCRLLTNMLDNAIEGCSDVPGEKYLTLRIRRKGQFLFFSCENSCNMGKLRYERGRLVSLKGAEHGYGLKIMAEIADKYNGLFRAEVKDGHFNALANLCLFDGEAGKEGDV